MKRRTRLNVTIVGAGKVGSVLGRVLVENGCRVVCVVSRTRRSANRVGRFLRSKLAVTDLESIPPETDLIFIATPHSAVTEVAGALARRKGLNFRRIAVCHASGMLTAAALEPLRQAGATVFSFHPLQTFPGIFRRRPLCRLPGEFHMVSTADLKGCGWPVDWLASLRVRLLRSLPT